MARFFRRALHAVAPVRRRGRVSLPAGRRVAAVGAVAVLGLAMHTGIPAAGARFPGRSAVPATKAGRTPRGRRATGPLADGAERPAVVPVETGQTGHGSGHNPAQASAFRQIILPDLLIVAPTGLTRTQIARLRKIAGVRDMITFDGAEITAGGRKVSVIGVNPATFRSWVPLATASNQAFWGALSNGEFVAGQSAATRLGLQPGAQVPAHRGHVAGRDLRPGGEARAVRRGPAGERADLPQARPGPAGGRADQRARAGLTSLTQRVQKVLGPAGRIEVLRSRKLPVAAVAPGTRPANYLQLFKASAAEYCPGLSWTVLAAIGQIESADGTNVGPSTAGAMGPMQFLPSTWAEWGIDGFGDTGPPNILNPYDAVPSAARLLCASGAAAGGPSLSRAIFDYNHATWYVNEVLALAAQYAADYR